jgi:hypothetical protein
MGMGDERFDVEGVYRDIRPVPQVRHTEEPDAAMPVRDRTVIVA